jgi:hypothetical protein
VDPLSDFAKKSFAAFKEKHGAKGPGGPGVPPSVDIAKEPAPQTDSAAGGAGGNSVPGHDHDHEHDHEGHSHDNAPPTSTAPPLRAIEQSGATTP